MGHEVYRRFGNTFPLLVKFLDTTQATSIQVHPNKHLAHARHNCLGKDEMWYVIDAQPGASIYAGFQQELTAEEYARKVEDGTILDALARHEVHAGDVFYLPAGRIHAIGKGVLLAEVQQTSDLTYRIYDYGRLDLNGRPRELHTEHAAQALDYKVYKEYRNSYKDTIDMANPCLDTEHFSVRVVSLTNPMHRNMVGYDSFVISTCVEGVCTLRIRSTRDEVELREGFSCLIPAAIADYDIVPKTAEVKLIESYINNKPQNALRRMISQFLHLSGL